MLIHLFSYVYGNESTTPAFPLDADKTYTFIVYSVNSKSDIPEIDGKNDLSTASLKNVSGDMMYFKKSRKLVEGSNNLNAVLQHHFSQVTTIIEMGDSMTGSIEAISERQFNPSKSSATLKFLDGSITHSGQDVNANTVFPAILASGLVLNFVYGQCCDRFITPGQQKTVAAHRLLLINLCTF